MKILLCFETVRPNKDFFDLCLELHQPNYEILVFIDDNSYNIKFEYDKEKIKVVQINNEECQNAGYKSLVRWMKNISSSKDKALYYIIKEKLDYDYVWFLEEDCFIPTNNTIKNIDIKYPNYDLLVKEHNVYETKQNENTWHWKYVYELCKIPPPYGKALVCALRCSKILIDKIKDYAFEYKNLFYCESIFNTLCIHHNLKVKVIPELKTMHWAEYKWKINEIKDENIYHPIKNMKIQKDYRTIMKRKK
jgi:hypothetical protein